MTAISFAVDTALVPLAGYVMDRYGRKYAGVPALVLSALGLVVLALAGTSDACVLAAVALGLGNGARRVRPPPSAPAESPVRPPKVHHPPSALIPAPD